MGNTVQRDQSLQAFRESLANAPKGEAFRDYKDFQDNLRDNHNVVMEFLQKENAKVNYWNRRASTCLLFGGGGISVAIFAHMPPMIILVIITVVSAVWFYSMYRKEICKIRSNALATFAETIAEAAQGPMPIPIG